MAWDGMACGKGVFSGRPDEGSQQSMSDYFVSAAAHLAHVGSRNQRYSLVKYRHTYDEL